jgi:hypothetical protein
MKIKSNKWKKLTMGTKTLISKEKKENPNKKPETKSNKYYNNLNKTSKMTKMKI